MRDLYARITFALCLGLASSALASPLPNADNASSPLGTNMGYHASWSSDWVFVDQFAKSRAWIASGCNGTWDTGQRLTLDSNGWVIDAPAGVCPQAQLMDGSNFPTGTYVLLWDGEGTLDARNGSGYRVTGPGRATFQVTRATQGSGIFVRINSFSRTRPVRNIRVLMPGGVCGRSNTALDHFSSCASTRGGSGSCATGETCFDFESVYWNRFADPVASMASGSEVVFHPRFVEKLKDYRTIRYMQWMRMNDGNPLESWSSRTLLTHQDQTTNKGLAYEYASALSNVLDADAWINVPHRANDAFVRSLAQLFRANLASNVKLYVEYTNEAWNSASAFPQNKYMMEREGCVYSSSTKKWTNCPNLGRRFFAQRTRQVMDIFTAEYGTNVGRIVRVMGGFAANAWWNQQLMIHLGANTGASRRVDAIAIAPYIGGRLGSLTNVVANDPRLTLNAIFTGIAQGVATSRQWITDNAVHARTYGVDLVAYEGGQHLAAVGANQNNQQMIDAFVAANRDSRMRSYYTEHLNDWRRLGGKLFNHYVHISSSGRQGAFGELESQTQETSPKLEALQGFVYGNDCWWASCTRSQ
jgi:hypothetical protein